MEIITGVLSAIGNFAAQFVNIVTWVAYQVLSIFVSLSKVLDPFTDMVAQYDTSITGEEWYSQAVGFLMHWFALDILADALAVLATSALVCVAVKAVYRHFNVGTD